jgi:hypothetical protein
MTAPFAIDGAQVVLQAENGPAPVKGGISPKNFAVLHAFARGWLTAAWLKDFRGVWFYHQRAGKAKFVTADSAQFRVLDDDYGLDGQNLYLEDRLVPGADPDTFELLPLSPYFARDRHRLYVKSGAHFFHVEMEDAENLIANGAYVTDRDHLFHHSTGLDLVAFARDRRETTHGFPGEGQMALRDWLNRHHPDVAGWWRPDYPHKPEQAKSLGQSWRVSEAAVFHRLRDTDARGHEIFADCFARGADPARFRALDDDYGTDGDAVFFRWRKLRGADPATFVTLGGGLGKDETGVWFNGHPVQGADPATFAPTPTERPYATDARAVYGVTFDRVKKPFGAPDTIMAEIAGCDPKTFRTFGPGGRWAADRAMVLRHGEVEKKIDAASFRFLVATPTNDWACDRTALYRSNGSLVVAGVDGGHFEMLDRHWGGDGKVVFSFVAGAVQKAADAASFRVTDAEGGAEDDKAVYSLCNGQVKRKPKRAGS